MRRERFIEKLVVQVYLKSLDNFLTKIKSFRMNHHHYQQRLNQPQQLPPQIHGIRPGLNGLTQQQQHQVPPPIIPKQHLHQNIATLNQKPPPQHLLSQNSQIQPTQRLNYESKFFFSHFTKDFLKLSTH